MNMLSIERFKPEEGQPVILTLDDRKRIVAYYNNGEFYRLKLDPVLGVLRKEQVKAKIWSHIENVYE